MRTLSDYNAFLEISKNDTLKMNHNLTLTKIESIDRNKIWVDRKLIKNVDIPENNLELLGLIGRCPKRYRLNECITRRCDKEVNKKTIIIWVYMNINLRVSMVTQTLTSIPALVNQLI